MICWWEFTICFVFLVKVHSKRDVTQMEETIVLFDTEYIKPSVKFTK